MKKVILLFILPLILFGQNLEIEWEDVYYENYTCQTCNIVSSSSQWTCQKNKEYRDGIKTNDGNYAFLADWWLMKSNSENGDIIWEHNFDALETASDYGEDEDDWVVGGGASVEYLAFDETNDLGFIILVKVRNWNNNNYEGGVYLFKTDSLGNIEEKISIDLFENQEDYLINIGTIKQTIDGGYIISGHADLDNNYSNETVFLHKLNSDFDTDWHNNFIKESSYYGTNWSVIEMSNGDYLLAGAYESTISDINGQNLSVSKHSYENGNQEWVKNYNHQLDNNGYTGARHDVLISIKEKDDGNYIIAGNMEGYFEHNACALCYTVELDCSIGCGSVGGWGTEYNDYAAYNSIWIAEINPNNEGEVINERLLSNEEFNTGWIKDNIVKSIDITSDGGCIIGGFQQEQIFIPSWDGTTADISNAALIIKLDGNLDPEWVETFHCEECGINTCEDDGDNIFLIEDYTEDYIECINNSAMQFISENNQGEYVFAGSDRITNQTDSFGELICNPQNTIWAGKIGVSGCTNENACNYCDDCSIDDGSCVYPETNFDCDGNCIVNIDCLGACGGDSVEDQCGNCDNNPSNDCTQDCAGVWGGNAIEDQCGVCDGDNTTCLGCTDNLACNYDNTAIINNNSCAYPQQYYDCDENCINDIDGDLICDELEIYGCTNPIASNYNPEATEDDGSCISIIDGCTDPLACNYNPNATADCIDCCDYESCLGCTDPNANNYCVECLYDDGSCVFIGCTDPLACNYDPNATLQCIDDCCDYESCLGCTDPNANNYCEECIYDDGSCVLIGCMDIDACNYDPNATGQCIDACCEYGVLWSLDVNGDGCGNSCAGDYFQLDLDGNPNNGFEGAYSSCSFSELPMLIIAGWPNATWADNNNCYGESISLDGSNTEHHWCTGMDESNNEEKILIKTIDVLGREIHGDSNTRPIIYIYHNGTVEKKYLIK